MTNREGFIVIRDSVSVALVKQLAAELDAGLEGKKPTVCREKYNEYEVSSLGIAVKDDFEKCTAKGRLASLFNSNAVPQQPTSVHLGIFHHTNADPSKLKTANEEEVYVTIAVTDLGQDNGWFTFYEGSHRRKPPLGQSVSLNLKAGDAVAWSGNIVYSHTPGGGGKFITLVYRQSTASVAVQAT